MNNPTYRRAAELLEADISNELVALEPDQGTCFGFNEVAKDVWRKLDQPCSFTSLRDYLLDEYDVDVESCSAQLRELLADMERAKLIERAGS